ncbi:hypothetical protein OQA88_10387 [Cercophora sp. LCS_1]
MIKASHMDVGVIVEFIKHHGVQPDWMLMQLPGGRNMNQCIRAAESMFNMPMVPPAISPLKRKSIGDIGDHISKKQAVASPGEVSPFTMARNVSTQSPGLGHPVNIQPRPNGYAPSVLPPTAQVTPISQNVVLPPRRRGRPPKAETLARQSGSQPGHYPPISPAPIAPSSVQAIAPRPQSPGSGSAYQVWSAAAAPETKAKKKGRQPAGDRQLPPPETVPRTVQGTSSAEADTRQVPGPNTEYHEWRGGPSARELLQGGSSSGQLGPSLPPILPQPRSPQPPLEGAHRAREPPTTTSLEQARPGSHTATVN